jgi:tRNA uridine 5-carbamoylmethylation protein Kti12
LAAEYGPFVDTRALDAVLITGVFGSGKTSVAVEIADVLGDHGCRYAVLDLDWLTWFNLGSDDDRVDEHRMMLTNLGVVVGNYITAGVERYVLARSIRDRWELDSLSASLPMPVRVVRLDLALDEIERRLRSDVTTCRQDDLLEAAQWIAASSGVGLEDLTITNDGPVRQVASKVVEWLGW